MRSEMQVVIGSKNGLHLRVASAFAGMARKFVCSVQVESESGAADGKSVLEMITLRALPGSKVWVRADCADADEAVRSLSGYLANPEEQQKVTAPSAKETH